MSECLKTVLCVVYEIKEKRKGEIYHRYVELYMPCENEVYVCAFCNTTWIFLQHLNRWKTENDIVNVV